MATTRRLLIVLESIVAIVLAFISALGIHAGFAGPAPDDPVGDGPAYLFIGGILLLPIAVGFAVAALAVARHWRPLWLFQLSPAVVLLLEWIFVNGTR